MYSLDDNFLLLLLSKDIAEFRQRVGAIAPHDGDHIFHENWLFLYYNIFSVKVAGHFTIMQWFTVSLIKSTHQAIQWEFLLLVF